MSFELENHPILRESLNSLKKDIIKLLLDNDVKNYVEKNKYNSTLVKIFSSTNFIRKIYFYNLYSGISDEEKISLDNMLEIANQYMSEIDDVLIKNPEHYSVYQFLGASDKHYKYRSFLKFYSLNSEVVENNDLDILYNETIKLIPLLEDNFMKFTLYNNIIDSIKTELDIYKNPSSEKYKKAVGILDIIKENYILTLKNELYFGKNDKNDIKEYIFDLEKLTILALQVSHRQMKDNKLIVINKLNEFLDLKDDLIKRAKANPILNSYFITDTYNYSFEKEKYDKKVDFTSYVKLNAIKETMIISDNNGSKITLYLLNRDYSGMGFFESRLDHLKFKDKLNSDEQDIFYRLKEKNKIRSEIKALKDKVNKNKEEDINLFIIEEVPFSENMGEVSFYVYAKKEEGFDDVVIINKNGFDRSFATEESLRENVRNGTENWGIFAKNINNGTQRVFKILYRKNKEINEELQKEFEETLEIYCQEILLSYNQPDIRLVGIGYSEVLLSKQALGKEIDIMFDSLNREFKLKNVLSKNEHNKVIKKKI